MAHKRGARRETEHRFSMIPSANIRRSRFNRSFTHKTTFNAGYLVPFLVDEVLPGDTFSVKSTVFARMATPIYPLMDDLYLDTFYFFVPNRLVWEHWQNFCGERATPDDSTEYLIPQLPFPSSEGWTTGSLGDYYGLPIGIAGDADATTTARSTALPFRAYNLIWNEWFRDENLQEPVDVPTGDGPDNPDSFALLRRGKRHDYFTSCLPWPQKGPGVEISLAEGNVPVTVSGDPATQRYRVLGDVYTPAGGKVASAGDRLTMSTTYQVDSDYFPFTAVRSGFLSQGPFIYPTVDGQRSPHYGDTGLVYTNSEGQYGTNSGAPHYWTNEDYAWGNVTRNDSGDVSSDTVYTAPVGLAQFNALGSNGYYTSAYFDPGTSFGIDASSLGAVTINSLRQAFQIQRLLERDARGGTRYTEILRAHFGVVSPDGRLQRPEYLGGNTQRVSISPVAQTSSTDTTSPQGNLSAFGLVASSKRGFTRSFVEHGILIGLMSVRADLSYQQGIPRWMSRQTRYDFYWPALAHLGEQAVLNKEIYAQGTSVDDEVFGYQERWAEYRYFPSMITGLMRSQAAQSLDAWHLAQDFEGLPALNADFIQDQPPLDRVEAVPSEPDFIADIFVQMRCVRPMPVYSIPGLIDHF